MRWFVDLSGLTVPSVEEREADRTVSQSDFSGARFDQAPLADVVVLGSDFREADLSLATFDDVGFSHVSFALADVDATWRSTIFHNVDFSGVDLHEVSFGIDTRFNGHINVSGVMFCHDEECAQGIPDDFWDWQDSPPIFHSVEDEDFTSRATRLRACHFDGASECG